jgi:hypothetical protein
MKRSEDVLLMKEGRCSKNQRKVVDGVEIHVPNEGRINYDVKDIVF